MDARAITMIGLLIAACIGGSLTVFKSYPSPWGFFGLILLTVCSIGMILVGFQVIVV
jgi:hypothetical protein